MKYFYIKVKAKDFKYNEHIEPWAERVFNVGMYQPRKKNLGQQNADNQRQINSNQSEISNLEKELGKL